MEDVTLQVSGYDTITFKPGEVIIQEGKPATWVYVLKEGSVNIINDNTVVATLSTSGAILGEIAYLFETVHTATVVAGTKTTLYVIDDFHEFLKKEPENIQKICRLMQLRLMNVCQRSLENTPLDLQLSGCSIEEISEKQTIIEEGKAATRIYILRRGTLKAISRGNVVYRGSNPGTMFGELQAFTESRYTVSVITVTPCSFYVIDDLGYFYKLNPGAGLKVTRVFAKQLESVIDQFTEFKAEVMRTYSQTGTKKLLSKLVHIDELLTKNITNPFSRRRK